MLHDKKANVSSRRGISHSSPVVLVDSLELALPEFSRLSVFFVLNAQKPEDAYGS